MKKILFYVLLFMVVALSIGYTYPAFAEEPTVAPAPGVTNAAEYQAYLNANFPTIATNLKTINVANYISVIEKKDQFKTYDIAVVIDYDVISPEVTPVLQSTEFTDEQKLEFQEAFKAYQKNISELTAATFPNKKIRGGFIKSGYQYKNLKQGYYEKSWYGWKNYSYDPNRQLNYYKHTTVNKLEWFDFGAAGAPLDNI